MSKVREFWGEHKVEIAIAAGIGISLVVGGVIGWKASGYLRPGSKTTDMFLKSASHAHPGIWANGYDMKTIENAYKTTDLGKFGELLIELGAPTDHKFTHILAIGPKMVE